MNYYNEHDPKAAAWLRELIKADLIAPGIVDERSICDVLPAQLMGFQQCHFFAGIGGWSYALRLAGWPDDRRIWTGSCPCQPFSEAGEGRGFSDERHLWPAWFHLIQQCNPSIIVGEQVASKNANAWLDLIQDDLEAMGYAVGAVPFPAASIGAPHLRDRLYWVADGAGSRWLRGRPSKESNGRNSARIEPERLCDIGGLADSEREGLEGHGGHGDNGNESRRIGAGQNGSASPESATGITADTDSDGRNQARKRISPAWNDGPIGNDGSSPGQPATGPVNGFWRDADWLFCRDGKWRPVEPGTFPLAHGIPGRVGLLRGYGNAIIPEEAAEFMKAFMETQTSREGR